jgi:hypothetical protein
LSGLFSGAGGFRGIASDNPPDDLQPHEEQSFSGLSLNERISANNSAKILLGRKTHIWTRRIHWHL